MIYFPPKSLDILLLQSLLGITNMNMLASSRVAFKIFESPIQLCSPSPVQVFDP